MGDTGPPEFLTPERFAAEFARNDDSPRGPLLIASCRSGVALARAVVDRYKEHLRRGGSSAIVPHLEAVDGQFSDTETYVRLEREVRGHDVFLFQSLYNPESGRGVDQNYMALMIAARAFRQWGAGRVTAVLPYLAYARQDKPSRHRREPTTAKLMADLSIRAGIGELVTWHFHSDKIPDFYDGVPVHALDPQPLFVEEYRRFQGRADVIVVAPDAGAARLVTYFGHALGLKRAFAVKHRPRPEVAEVTDVVGEFDGKRVAIVLDDMISSGGTIGSLVRALVRDKGIEEVHLGVSHNLCMDSARAVLLELHADYHVCEVVVTDSIPQTEAIRRLPFVSVRPLAERLGLAVNRIHYGRPVSEMLQKSPETAPGS